MSLGGLFGNLIAQLPVLAVLVIGGILLIIRRGRLPRRAVTLGLIGLGVLLLGELANLIWVLLIPTMYDGADLRISTLSVISAIIALVLALVHAAGLGLVVAGLLSRSGPAPATPGFAAPAPYPPASYPPGPSAPQGNFPPAYGAPSYGTPGAQPQPGQEGGPAAGWGAPQQGWTPPADPPQRLS